MKLGMQIIGAKIVLTTPTQHTTCTSTGLRESCRCPARGVDGKLGNACKTRGKSITSTSLGLLFKKKEKCIRDWIPACREMQGVYNMAGKVNGAYVQ